MVGRRQGGGGLAAVVAGLVLVAISACAPKPVVEARKEPPAAPKPEVEVARPLVRGLKSRTIILTYHDMVERRDGRSVWFDCTPEELTQQLDWLRDQGATFLDLRTVREGLTGQVELPERTVAICFADNYDGFYRLAWPILRDRGIPVTVFVHTDHVGSRRGRPKMTWDQVRELESRGLVTAESQTMSHPKDLSKLPDEQIRAEFVGSKSVLERELRRPVTLLAYPNGKWDARCERLAREAGYLMAFTEEQTPAEESPNEFSVARYVHTKWREAWREAHGR